MTKKSIKTFFKKVSRDNRGKVKVKYDSCSERYMIYVKSPGLLLLFPDNIDGNPVTIRKNLEDKLALVTVQTSNGNEHHIGEFIYCD